MPGPRRDKAVAWKRLEQLLDCFFANASRIACNRSPFVRAQDKQRVLDQLQRLKESGRLDSHQVGAIRLLLDGVWDLIVDELIP